MRALQKLTVISTLLASLTICSNASADIIYETKDPFGGRYGLWGADVAKNHAVAMRFTPEQDYSLNSISLWFMNNSVEDFASVGITLRSNTKDKNNADIPGGKIIEHWDITISANGWEPQQEHVVSTRHTELKKGQEYWIVAVSDAALTQNPVWNYASEGSGFSAYTDSNGDWQPGGDANALTATIEGSPIIK
jgi:carbohydrate-binding DOMON domain-containing protein